MKKENKPTKKIEDKITKEDEKFLKLMKIAEQIVLKEDEMLLKELAKH